MLVVLLLLEAVVDRPKTETPRQNNRLKDVLVLHPLEVVVTDLRETGDLLRMKTLQTKDVLVVAQPEEATEATLLAGPGPERLTKDLLVIQAPPESVTIAHQTKGGEANAQEKSEHHDTSSSDEFSSESPSDYSELDEQDLLQPSR